MKRIMPLAVALAGFSATAFPADRHIAFERNNAVYVANFDGTNDMSGDGRIDVSPDSKRLLLASTWAKNPAAKIGTGRCRRSGRSIPKPKRRPG
jgi:hypothetical protein